MTEQQPNLRQARQDLDSFDYYFPPDLAQSMATPVNARRLDEFITYGTKPQQMVNAGSTSSTSHSAPLTYYRPLDTTSILPRERPDALSWTPYLSAPQPAMTADSQGSSSNNSGGSQVTSASQQPAEVSNQRPTKRSGTFDHKRAKQETRVNNGSLEHRVNQGNWRMSCR